MKRTAADARWSKAVRERDNYTCQRCGTVHAPNSQGLHAAHIFGRGRKVTRCVLENGVALCYGCHRFVDGNPYEREALGRRILGDEAYEELDRRSKMTLKQLMQVEKLAAEGQRKAR